MLSPTGAVFGLSTRSTPWKMPRAAPPKQSTSPDRSVTRARGPSRVAAVAKVADAPSEMDTTGEPRSSALASSESSRWSPMRSPPWS